MLVKAGRPRLRARRPVSGDVTLAGSHAFKIQTRAGMERRARSGWPGWLPGRRAAGARRSASTKQTGGSEMDDLDAARGVPHDPTRMHRSWQMLTRFLPVLLVAMLAGTTLASAASATQPLNPADPLDPG